MGLGKFVLLTAGVVVVGAIGYAASKSGAVDKAATAAIKAGIKTKDWAVETYEGAKEDIKSMAQSAKTKQTTEEAS